MIDQSSRSIVPLQFELYRREIQGTMKYGLLGKGIQAKGQLSHSLQHPHKNRKTK